MRIQVSLMIGVALFVSACNTLSAANDVAAVISQPSDESRAELARVVSSALNGIRITLAEDALTRGSLLILERNPHRDLQGRRISGRNPGRPEQFRLVINGSDCILVHQSSGFRWHLKETKCAPERLDAPG